MWHVLLSQISHEKVLNPTKNISRFGSLNVFSLFLLLLLANMPPQFLLKAEEGKIEKISEMSAILLLNLKKGDIF